MDPLLSLSALDLVRRMQNGAVSAVEVMQAHIRRIDVLEPSIRAWAYLNREPALAAAARADAAREAGHRLGVLHGLPVGVKDIIDTADMPTEYGTKVHQGRRPTQDATIVARLRAAGAIVLGKTVTSEYALYVPGPTRNPWDTTRTPGGSSSGSAAAVAARMVPVALATQSNGSTIRPASFCGIVGYKPGLGVLPRTGILRQSTVLDQPGVMARTIADVALLTDAISGRDDADKRSLDLTARLLDAARGDQGPPRFAFVRGPYWARADAETRAAVESFVRALEAPVTELDLPTAFATAADTLSVLMDAGVAQAYRADYDRARAWMPELVNRTIERGRVLSGAHVRDALAQREDLVRLFDQVAAPFDALLTPAAVGVAPMVSEGTGDPIFATTWTLVGAPSITMPVLTGTAGLPIGLQLVAGSHRDASLLRAASWVMRTSTIKAEATCAF
jgi:Asp-tRNA(Asn)/Glu-tRNA(Gln) amidotransferase A subunit family amidase